jgi:hypothetical protein
MHQPARQYQFTNTEFNYVKIQPEIVTEVFDIEDMNTSWPKFDTSFQKEILSRVFNSYLTKLEDCNGTGDLEQDRKTGNFVPIVQNVIRGSFTHPYTNEQLFTIHIGECSATKADRYGTKQLVVFKNGQPIFSLNLNGDVQKRFDLDKDGQDEWLLSYGMCDLQSCFRGASVMRFNNGQIEKLIDLDYVYESYCGNENNGEIKWKSVKSIFRQKLEFQIQEKMKLCK